MFHEKKYSTPYATPSIMRYPPLSTIRLTPQKSSGTLGTLEHPNDFKDLQTPQMEHYQTTNGTLHNRINNLARNITF